MTWKRAVLGLFGLAAIALLAWAAVNRQHLEHFPSIISSFYAKQMCSCLFVVGLSEERCHNESRQYVPISGCEIDWENKAVTVRGLGRTNRAHYVNDRFGCVLDELD